MSFNKEYLEQAIARRHARISQRQLAAQAFEISRDGEVMGAVWKAPHPFNDWYYGRIVLGGESDGTTLLMTLEGCGTGKTQEQAVGALIEWRDGGGE